MTIWTALSFLTLAATAVGVAVLIVAASSFAIVLVLGEDIDANDEDLLLLEDDAQ